MATEEKTETSATSGVFEVLVDGKRAHVGFSNDIDRVVSAYKTWGARGAAPVKVQEALNDSLGKKITKENVDTIVSNRVLVECHDRDIASKIKRAYSAGDTPDQELLDAAKASLSHEPWGRKTDDDAADDAPAKPTAKKAAKPSGAAKKAAQAKADAESAGINDD